MGHSWNTLCAELVCALLSAKAAFDWEKKTEPRVAIPNDADRDVEEALRLYQSFVDKKKLGKRFDGEFYDPLYDDDRLESQLGRVFDCMKDGIWRTLSEISAVTNDPEASISAQLRHLRKPRFGLYVVELRPRGHRKVGLFEYCLTGRIDSLTKKIKKI